MSRSFFSISFIAACFWEVLSSPFRKDILNDRRRGTLTWSQKVFFVRSWFPGELLIPFYSIHVLPPPISQRAHWSSFNFRRFLSRRYCNTFCLEMSLFLKKKLCSFKISLLITKALIWFWIAGLFSKFKKNSVDFSPFSYQSHLLLILRPSTSLS